MNLTICLNQLTGCYAFAPNGMMTRIARPTRGVVAKAIVPGCEDASMIESVRLSSGREMRFNSFAERDEPVNPLATHFLGAPVYGTAVVMPPEKEGK